MEIRVMRQSTKMGFWGIFLGLQWHWYCGNPETSDPEGKLVGPIVAVGFPLVVLFLDLAKKKAIDNPTPGCVI